MAYVLIDAAATTGAGAAQAVRFVEKHTLQITFTNSGGAVTALEVTLEGTLDNVRGDDASPTWFPLKPYVFTAANITDKGAMIHIVNKPVIAVRANITTLTDSGTSAVTVKYQGDEGGIRL